MGRLELLAQLNIKADKLAGTHQQILPDPSPCAYLMLAHTGAHE